MVIVKKDKQRGKEGTAVIGKLCKASLIIDSRVTKQVFIHFS